MATRAELVDELLKFSAADRAEAARTLLESLDDGDAPADVEVTWRAEIASRVRQVDGGSVELEDGPAVMRGLRERARARLERAKP